MNKCSHAGRSLFLGLLAAQVLATLQVYLSNADLYDTLVAVRNAGYLTIPNPHITPTLKEFGPAIFGGLFFTLSVGAGLSIFSLTAAWIWDRLLLRNKYSLIVPLLLLVACIIEANRRGLCLLVTSYFVLIPIVTFASALRWMVPQASKGQSLREIVHIIPVFVLVLLFSCLSQQNIDIFVDFRDSLLLTNPLGTKINDFYYKYTLYPAEVFKPLDQKLMKTCTVEDIKEKTILSHVETELRNHDYLDVGRDKAADLNIIEESGDVLVFKNEGKTILRTTLKDFLSDPASVLKDFSSKSDRDTFFRHFTFVALLIGLPLTLYVFFYTLLCRVLSLFLNAPAASVLAATFCFLTGTAIFFSLYSRTGEKTDVNYLSEALASESWQDRVGALKTINHKGLDIGNFQAYQRIRSTPHIVERYWLVRALGISRKPETYKDLLAFLDDSQPNVVSMAYYSLGRRRNKGAIKEILQRIQKSEDWYNQWYAYQALKALGWKQTKSKSTLSSPYHSSSP
jgi:hypothetical protein